ncbi:MAG: hypothetical protein JW787_10720 [Sedimentisphaerales bacterium]|nr:hypothetical protein [Sedimentisphaerales bacterium]
MLLQRNGFFSLWRIVVIVFFLISTAICQSQKPDPRAEKYFNLLIQNPVGDYLYDSFYDAWLDTGTVESLETFLKQYSKDSSGSTGSLLLAYFYERQGKDSEALEFYQKAAETGKTPNPDLLYQKASLEARLLDIESAISDLNTAADYIEKTAKNSAQVAELNIKIGKLLGRLYIRNDKKEDAAKTWEKLIQTYPDDEDLFEDLIELQLSEGLYEQALETSDRLLKKTKDNYKLVMRQLRKADIYQYSGKSEQALDLYAKTLELVGQGTWLENQICSQIERVFRREDNIRALREFWEKFIEAEPQRISIKKRFGQLLLQFGEFDEALNLFQEIVRITPGEKQNQQTYINALKSTSQTEKAVEMMKQLCQRNPDDRELLIELADLYYLNRDAQAVIETLEAFLDKSDKSEYVFLRVARLLENYGYKEKTLEVFEKLLAQAPDSLTAKEAYAEILYRYDQKEKALEIWDKIALTGDMQTLLRIAKIAGTRGFEESSLSWLEARYDEFENDISFLYQLCEEAIRQGLYEKSLPWLQKQLLMSDRISLIQASVKQRLLIEKNKGTIEKTISELKSQKQRTIQETCLLSELLEYCHLSDEAQSVLGEFIPDANNSNTQDTRRNAHHEIALQQKIHLFSAGRQWDKAAECTKELIELKGTHESSYVRELISLYEKSGQSRTALEWIPVWKKSSPGSTEPILTESRILRRLYEIDTAIEKLRAADQLFENNKEIMAELALLYRSSNKNAQAYRILWRLYDEAEDISDKLDYMRDIAAVSRNMGNSDALIEKLLERRNSDRTSVIPLLAMSEVYRQMGKHEERLQVLMEAARLRPNDVSLLHEIARIEESEGFWEQAIETLQQAMLLDATASTKQKLARLYIQYGSEEQGFDILYGLSESANINPRDAQTTAETMIAGTNFELAGKFLEEVLTQHPQDYKLAFLYAMCLEENGEYEQALENFFQILEIKQEIPGNTAQSLLSQRTGSLDYLGKILPPGAIEILSLQQIFSQAYRYQRQYNNLPYWYMGSRSSQSQTIDLPPTVDDLPGFAMAHILSLGKMLNEADKTAGIADELKNKIKKYFANDSLFGQFSSLDFILDMDQFNFDNLSGSISELVKKYPENESLLGLYAMYISDSAINSNQQEIRRVFDTLKKNYPQLACTMGLWYGSREKTASDILEESFNLLKNITNLSDYEVSRYAQVLRAQDNILSQPQKSLITEKMISWYDKENLQSPQNQSSNLFYSIAGALINGGDVDRFINILNKEVANFRKRAVQNPQVQVNQLNQLNQVFISSGSFSRGQMQMPELNYPPYNLPDFPNVITQLFFQRSSEYAAFFEKLLNSENIDSFISKLEDPILKSIVYIAANNENKALEILNEQIEAQTKSVSAHIITATILAKQNKKEQAIIMLGKAASPDLDASVQQVLDSAMVSYSLGLDLKTIPEALESARNAAVRLGKSQFSQSYRDVLIQAMGNLGLGDEARQLARRYVSAQSTAGAFTQGMYTILGRTTDLSAQQYNRIVEMFREEKKEPAMRLLLSDLKFIAGESLLPDRSNESSNINDRLSLVHAYKVEDKIIELSDPSPTRSVRKLLIFARLCDLLGKKERAKQVYEEILRIKPNEFGAGVWLAFLSAADDPDKSVECLLAIDNRYQSQLGQQLSNYIQNNYNRENVKYSYDIVEIVAQYLDNVKDVNSTNLSWVTNIPRTIANSYSRNNIRLPQLYSESQTNTQNNINFIKEQEELAQRRREVHNRLCRSMLRFPYLASQGFAYLHSEARARNAVSDDIVKIAIDAMLKYRPSSGGSSSGGLLSTYNWGFGRDKKILSPLEFLIYYNWQKGTLNEFVEEIVPILEKNNRIGEAKQVRLLVSLYQASPENYISQAKNILESDIISGGSSQYALLSKDAALSHIIEIRADRALKINLNQFLIEQININDQNRIYQVRDFVRSYLGELVKEDQESAKKFLDDIVNLYLGPKEKRGEFIRQYYNNRQMSGSTANNQRIQICFDFLRTMVQNGELLFTVLSQFEDFEGYVPDIRYYVQNGLDNAFNKAINSVAQGSMNTGDFKVLMEMLNESPFLGDVNSFKILPVAQLQNNSVYGYMMYRFWQSSGTQYKNLRSLLSQSLEQRSSQTVTGIPGFGTELLIAQLSDNRRSAVYDCIGKYWEQLQKIDPKRQQEISMMLCDTVGMMTAKGNSLTDDMKLIVSRLNELRAEAGKEKVTEFMVNKRFEDFRINESQFYENTSNLINSLVSYDVDAGLEILVKAEGMISDAQKRGQYRNPSNQSLTARVIDRMRSDSRNFAPGSIGFLVKLIRDSNVPDLRIEPSYVMQFEYPIYERYNQYRQSLNNNTLEALKVLYQDIGPYAGEGNLSGLSSMFRRVFESGNWNEQTVNEAINWANKQTESGDYPSLAKLFAVNASFYKQQRFSRTGNFGSSAINDNSFLEIQQYYQEVLADPNLSLVWRLMSNYALEQYLGRDSSFMSRNSSIEQQTANKELLMLQINLIIEGWKVYQNLNSDYFTNTIRRFINSGSPNNDPSNRNLQNAVPIETDVWMEAAGRLADAYMSMRQPAQTNTLLTPSGSAPPFISSGGRSGLTIITGSSSYDSNATIQLAMLEINLRLNRHDAVRTMLDGFDSRAGTYLDCWALLVKYNQANIFKAVVEKQWSNNINQMNVVRFDSEIEKNLSDCLNLLQSADISYFAEVMISSLSDEGNSRQRLNKDRNARLRELAGKFGDVVFNSVPIKSRILELYVNDSQLIPLVSEHVLQAGKNIDFGILAATQDTNLVRTQSRILAYYCTDELMKGDPNAFLNVIKSFSTYPGQNPPSGVRQVYEVLSQEFINKTNNIQNNWTEQQILMLADVSAEFLANSNQYYSPSRMVSNVVVLYVLAGKEEKIPAAMERCSAQIRQNLSNYMNLYELSNTLGRFIRSRNLPIEKKIDIIKRFYQTEQVQTAMSRENQSNMMSYLTNYNVLTRQEIEQYGELLKGLFVQTKQIEAFLQAKSVREITNINANEDQLRQYVLNLLNSTLWQDVDLCVKILTKTNLFIHEVYNLNSQNAESAMQSAGIMKADEFVSSILVQRDGTYFTLVDLGIATKLTRDANSPQIVLSRDYLQRVTDTVFERYRRLINEKNQNKVEAVKSLYELIGPYFGKGNASGLSGLWVTLFQNDNWNQTEIDSIIEWVNKQIESGSYPGLAREIKFACAARRRPAGPFGRSTSFDASFDISFDASGFQRSSVRRSGTPEAVLRSGSSSRRGMTESVQPEVTPEKDESADYYLNVIADSNLSVIWRLMALEEFRKRSQYNNVSYQTNSELVMQALPLVIEGWRQYPNLPESYCSSTVSEFLKMQDKPKWKELAEQLSAAYEEFRLKKKNIPAIQIQENAEPLEQALRQVISRGARGGMVVSSGRLGGGFLASEPEFMSRTTGQLQQNPALADSSISSIEKSMLEIRLIINKDALIQAQLNNNDNPLGKSLDTWALLAQYGRDVMLAGVIEKFWQTASTHSSLLYTKEIEASIKKCLAGISREDIRYFAEVVLSSLPDSPQQEHVPAASHKERIVRLAGQYNKVNFDEHIIKQRILALLINEPDALEFVSDSLTEQAAKIDIGSLFLNFNNSSRDQFNLVLASCCEKILTGDPNHFINTVKSVIINSSSAQQNTGRELLNTMAENLLKTADCIKSNWSVSQMSALASAATEFFVQSNVSLNSTDTLFINHCIFFVLSEKVDELQREYNRFSSQTQWILQNWQRYERLPEYYAKLAEYLVNRNLSFEQRLSIISRLHKMDWIVNTWSQRGNRGNMPGVNIVQSLIDHKIFTRQETIDNSSSFSELMNPAISSFLNIKNIAELNSDFYQLDSYVNNILTSVTVYDTDIILKIITKAAELNQQMLNSGTSRTPLGQDFIGRIISRLIQQDGNRLQSLNIVIKLMRDTKGQKNFPDSSLYQIDREIASLYTQTIQVQTSKLDVIKNIYQQVGPYTGSGNASGISGIFSSLFSNQQWRDNQLLDSIIQWAGGETQNGQYSSFAREIEMTATVYRFRPMFGFVTDSEKVRPVIEHYKNVLADENLSLQWRLMTVHAFESWISYPMYDELADQAMLILSRCSSESTVFNWDLYNNLLNRFVRSATQQQMPEAGQQYNFASDVTPLRPGWSDLASKVLNIYLESRARRRPESEFPPAAFRMSMRQYATVSELVMFETSLLLKNNEAAMKLVSDSEGTLKTSSCSLALLAQYRNKPLFEQFVRDNINIVRLDSRGLYNPQIEDRLTESLQNITRKDIQYLIKVFLYAHNNSSQPMPFPYGSGELGNISTRQERLKDLAMQLNEITFESDILKKQALILFIQEVSTLPYISSALDEQAMRIDLSSLLSTSQSNASENPDFQLLLANKMNLLLKGDIKSFSDMIIAIKKNLSNPQGGFSSNSYIMAINTGFLKLITGTEWKTENIEAFLEITQELLSSFDNRSYSSSILQLICCRAALLLLADESSNLSPNTLKEIESTFALIKPYQENFGGSMNSITIRSNEILAAHQVLARYMCSTNMTFEKRLEILKKLYSLEQITGAMSQQGSSSMMSLVTNEKIFSVEEVIANADTLMALPVVNETCWQNLAFYQARQGLLSEAEKSWRKAVEIGIKAETPWNGMQGYMYFLNTNNLREKALENWRLFDTKSLSQKSLSEYKTLTDNLENRN